jgi:hypothetical protein
MGLDVNNNEGLTSLLCGRKPSLSTLMLNKLSTLNQLEKLKSRRKLGRLRSNLKSIMLTLLLTSDLDFMGFKLSFSLAFLLSRLTISFISALAPSAANFRLLLNNPPLPFG